MHRMNTATATRRVAFFVTPHGFGHAARAAAIMAAMHHRDAAFLFDIFTKVPDWFFRDSVPDGFTYHAVLTDVGMVQSTPLRENLPATLDRLDGFLPFNSAQVTRLAEKIRALGCEAVVCDIAPLGIAVAREAGIPSVLVENFTWDWIYGGYVAADRRFETHAAYLNDCFSKADAHVQTEPVCYPRPDADLLVAPVSRSIRTPAEQVRKKLGIPAFVKMVILTMGGTAQNQQIPESMSSAREIRFVIPGGASALQVRGNLIRLPHHSDFFHPDLVNASDAVIGKVGYSTVAEVYRAGVPFGYISRPHFRESRPLAEYVQERMRGIEISQEQWQNGAWVRRLPQLLALPRAGPETPNGADRVAEFLCNFLEYQ